MLAENRYQDVQSVRSRNTYHVHETARSVYGRIPQAMVRNKQILKTMVFLR